MNKEIFARSAMAVGLGFGLAFGADRIANSNAFIPEGGIDNPVAVLPENRQPKSPIVVSKK